MEKIKKQLLNKKKLMEKKRSVHTKDLIEILNEFTIKTQLSLLEDVFTSYISIHEQLADLDEDDQQQEHIDKLMKCLKHIMLH